MAELVLFVALFAFLSGLIGCKNHIDGDYAKIAGNASSIDARAGMIQDIAAKVAEKYAELLDLMQLVTGQAAHIRLEAAETQKAAWELQGELQTERNWRIYEADRANWWFSPKQHNIALAVCAVIIAGYALALFGGSAGPIGWIAAAARHLLPFAGIIKK